MRIVDTAKTFFEALRGGTLQDIRDLLEQGVDPDSCNEDGESALFWAARKSEQHAEIIGLLLEFGADINAHGPKGDTALIQAVHHDNFAGAKLLLEKGADKNAVNNSGESALIWAAGYGKIDMTALLLKHNPDLMLETKNGATAYDCAAENGYTDVAKMIKTHAQKLATQQENAEKEQAFRSESSAMTRKIKIIHKRSDIPRPGNIFRPKR